MLSASLTTIFGEDRVQCERIELKHYLQNVCGANREVLGIVYPQTEQEIIDLVDLSRLSHIPLYPLSKGKNYGLGSRLPVLDGHLIVDLSMMKRILSFDPYLGIIQIEPGVTQQDIADYLKKINANFILNVTGSSAQSSLVGNALERGIAHYGSRVGEVINMTLVLGDGTTLCTEMSVGPDLKGLFFQSNFGIVTSMTLRLLPKTQHVATVMLEKPNSVSLDVFIDQLRVARQRQLLPDNIHISNSLRRLSVVTPLVARQNNISLAEASQITKRLIKTDWAATSSIRGEKSLIELQIKLLTDFMDQYATVSHTLDIDLEKLTHPLQLATKGTFGHALGIPCDDALHSLGYGLDLQIDDPVEESNVGTLFLVPILPFKGKDFVAATQAIINKFTPSHFDAYMTFNLVNEIYLEGVINLTFLKSDTQSTRAAHQCIQETLTDLENKGYPPMRLSIFQRSERVVKNKSKRSALKNIFDPDNIIARGRYEE